MWTKLYSILLSAICISATAMGQQTTLDSLHHVYMGIDEVNEEKFQILLNIAWRYGEDLPDTSLLLIEEAQIMAEELNDPKLRAAAYQAFIAPLSQLGKFEQALGYTQGAIEIYTKLEDHEQVFNCMQDLAWIQNDLGEFPQMLTTALELQKYWVKHHIKSDIIFNTLGAAYDGVGRHKEAIIEYRKGLQLKIAENKEGAISPYLNNLSISFASDNQLDSAIHYIEWAIKLDSSASDEYSLGYSLHTAGGLYITSGEYLKAMDYLESSLANRKKIKHELGIADCHHEIGKLFTMTGLGSYAEDNLMGALKIAQKIGEKHLEASALTSILELRVKQKKDEDVMRLSAQIKPLLQDGGFEDQYSLYHIYMGQYYDSKNQADLAIHHYKECISIQARLEYKNEWAIALSGLAENYLKTGQYDLARISARDAYIFSKQYKSLKSVMQSAHVLYRLCKADSSFAQALEYYEVYETYKDKLAKEELKLKEAKYHIKSDIAFKEHQIKELELQNQLSLKESENYRVLLLWASIVALLFIGLTVLAYIQTVKARKLNKALTLQRNELENLNDIQRKLFSIIAHDLKSPFNTLTGLLSLFEDHSLTDEEFRELASKVKGHTFSLGSTLENLLVWARPQLAGIQPDQTHSASLSDAVRSQTNLLRAASEEKSLKLQLTGLEDVHLAINPPALSLVVRNLIANAIKFSWEGGTVSISATVDLDAKCATVTIQDHGVGMTTDQQAALFHQKINESTLGTKNERGTGLGLVVVREIVERVGGSIRADSEKGEGATFHIQLPLS